MWAEALEATDRKGVPAPTLDEREVVQWQCECRTHITHDGRRMADPDAVDVCVQCSVESNTCFEQDSSAVLFQNCLQIVATAQFHERGMLGESCADTSRRKLRTYANRTVVFNIGSDCTDNDQIAGSA